MRALITISLFFFATISMHAQGYFKAYLENQILDSGNDRLIPVVIKLKKQVELKELKNDLIKQNLSLYERRKVIVNTLYRNNHEQTDFDFLLKTLKEEYPLELIEIKKFWAVNAIACKATTPVLNLLLNSPDIEYIQYDAAVKGEEVKETKIDQAKSVGGAEPGLVAVHARGMWSLGYTGRNRIAMNIDTGVSIEHPTLGDRFLGHFLPLSQAWLGYENPYPYDIDRQSFHGTHTMGTMIGLDTATADTIGFAFNSFWIASDPIVTDIADVRPMSDYFIAFEWALNPDGDTATTTDIPDVINNSWGVVYSWWPDCNPIEYDFIEALEMADCAVIFSAGNEGPGVSTTGMPASITVDSLNIFSVGALDGNSSSFPIASFSSRGPSLCDVSSPIGIKPEVSAPGVSVRSASGTDSYKYLSGTSMAGPHVAGAVLLLREAFPDITSMAIKNALYQTAVDLGDLGEDNTYGRGIIDVFAAYEFLSQTFTPTAPLTNQYDIAIESVTGQNIYTCSSDNQYDVEIKNLGTDPLSDFIFRAILNADTIVLSNLNITIQSNESFIVPVNFTIVDTNNVLLFQIEKTGVSEFNIYNNYKTLNVTKLFSNSIPFYEGFETLNADLTNSNFEIYNPDHQNTWRLDSTVGISGSYRSLQMPFAYYEPNAGQLDYFISGGFDIPSTGQTYMYFKHSYTQYFNSKKDSLFILISNTCDLSSADTLYKNGGATLKTRSSNLMGYYTPSDSTEWADNEINLTDYSGQTVYLKFISKNAASNNLYIDELRIENGIDLGNQEIAGTNIKFYPNPTHDYLYFKNLKDGESITIMDIRGVELIKTNVKDQQINVSELSDGIYYIKSTSCMIGKLIIQK